MPNTLRARKAFENKTDVVFRDGKELNGWLKSEGLSVARITLQKANRDIPPGTLRMIAKNLYVDVPTLCKFVNCTIKGPEFLNIVSANKKLT